MAFNAGLPAARAAAPDESAAVGPQATTPNPTSVTLAGSLQSEMGCAGDWDPACALSHMAYDASDDVWQASYPVPAGNYEYKAALNDSWTENYGQGGVLNGEKKTVTIKVEGEDEDAAAEAIQKFLSENV